jgi:hypothetical protein
MTMATNNHKYVFDSALEMKDAGLVASSAAAQVDSADKILNLGDSYMEGAVVIDVTAIEVATGNELYQIGWQLSDSATFASGIYEAATLCLGDSSVIGGDTDSATGRYILRVSNEHAGSIYTYARLYTTVSGTVATGINFSAHLCPG